MTFHRSFVLTRYLGRWLLPAALVGAGAGAGAGCGDNAKTPPPGPAAPPIMPADLQPMTPITLGELGIAVDGTRPFVHTNKESAYYYGEAAGPHRTGWQGFNVRGFTFLDDWHWTVASDALGSERFGQATIYPDHAVRRYDNGLSERITLMDGKAALLIEPTADAGPVILRPLMADGRSSEYYDIRNEEGALLIARRNQLDSSPAAGSPLWLAVMSPGASAEIAPELVSAGGVKPTMFSPGTLALDNNSPVVFAVADTPEAALALATEVVEARDALKTARAERMQGLLEKSYVVTEDVGFSHAMAWVRLSMDALVMNQRGKGIFAGLPWFNNYWGRDSFISLPGALLVTGEFEEAREILTSFSEFQNTSENDPSYGRIPNFVSLQSVAYNTADGTPWFVIQAGAYADYSGDEAFLQEIWPVVERAAAGGIRHVDAETGLFTHGDQETWMDASAGPGREWSPRGNRAVELQGLWYEQLMTSARIAEAVGMAEAAADYRSRAESLQAVFLGSYYDEERGLFIDHLNADGTADTQLRPNQFFALRSFALDPALERAVTRRAAEALVYPYGVASLEQTDDGFHPYHEAPEYYPKDAAYHNGTIWTWLSGPLLSLMVEQGAADKAYDQIDYLSRLALERGAVGAIAENQDALPRDGNDEPYLSGTVFQAWSHAEYLRNVYQDFAGVRYASPRHVVLRPSLPRAWGRAQVRFRMGDGYVIATMQQASDDRLDVLLRSEGTIPADAMVTVEAFGRGKDVSPASSIAVTMMPNTILVGTEEAVSDSEYTTPDVSFWEGFAWQQPMLRDGLPALDGPGFPLLDNATIKEEPAAGAAEILSLSDEEGDDGGPGPGDQYAYPLFPAFEPGMLDVVGLTIREDVYAYYFDLRFAKLVQPGWHPEYGFQLTFAALLLGTEPGDPAEVGRNAKYTSPEGFQYVIYVGGGLLIQDAEGNTLAEYRPAPADVENPLGSTDTGAITFRIPKEIIPELPGGTRVTVLAGSQDDHGGGGIGDFREVAAEAGEWVGGGKSDPAQPNVYDLMAGVIELMP